LLVSEPMFDPGFSVGFMFTHDFFRRYDAHQRLEDTTKRYTVTFE